jgi:hypothetical protein
MKRLLRYGLLLGVVGLMGYKTVVHGLTYQVMGFRPAPPPLDHPHLAALQTRLRLASGDAPTPTTLRQFALTETARCLHFALKRNALTDPNKMVEGRQAHCKMYAYVLAATYNQLARQQHWPASCRVAYGHVYLYGVSLHQFLPGTFFRDHDFCVFADNHGAYAVDATLYDYFWVERIRLRTGA